MRYVLGLGGNLGDPRATLLRALDLIEEYIGSVSACSPWYWSKPLLHPVTPWLGQEPHLNAVAAVDSELAPEAVLDQLMVIEEALGRVRAREIVPWGPRVVDLDIIAAGDLQINSDRLTVPHPEMHKRDFVLVPMAAINPEWRHPQLGKTVRELEGELTDRCIIQLDAAGREARSSDS